VPPLAELVSLLTVKTNRTDKGFRDACTTREEGGDAERWGGQWLMHCRPDLAMFRNKAGDCCRVERRSECVEGKTEGGDCGKGPGRLRAFKRGRRDPRTAHGTA
jgi:hypothetical protein